MRLFYPRRNRYTDRSSTIAPWMIVLICVVAAFLITVIVGNLLRLFVSEELYYQLTSGNQTETDTETTVGEDIRVPNIIAFAYQLGDTSSDTIESVQLSIALNNIDGTLNYTSAVSSYFALQSASSQNLEEGLAKLNATASYISGVFIPQSLGQENENEALSYATIAKEGALLREFLAVGGNEILLCNLPFEEVGISAVVNYIQQLKSHINNAPIGVAIPLSYLQANDNSAILLNVLSNACDFYAVDLTEADDSRSPKEWIEACGYFRSQYGMRLLFAEYQTDLITGATNQSLPNWQTVHRPLPPNTEDEEN